MATRRGRVGAWLACLACVVAFESAPRIGVAAEPGRPSVEPLPTPSPGGQDPRPRILPPIPPRAPDAGASPLGADRLHVSRWVFEGNRIASDEVLARVVEPWTERAISPAELQQARDALTLHYVERGYVTSGARIPDQEIEAGVVRVQIFEGSLAEVEFRGQDRLSTYYLRNQLGRLDAGPLYVPTLEEKIRLLQQDARIDRVDAALRPGAELGQARLELVIREATPFEASAEVSNFLAPSLGEVRGRAQLRHLNLTGLGDEFSVLVGGYEAGPEIEGRYRIPFGPFGTSLGIAGRFSDSELVDRIGEELRIEGVFWNVEFDLRQPVYRSPSLEIALGAGAALRQSNTELLGEEINEVGGRTRVFAYRVFQELLWRGGDQVLAARSTTSIGSLGLGATRSHADSVPDSQFVSWLAQLQFLKRFGWWNVELLLRGDVQLSEDPLLSIEQYAVGGHASVRGYRENQLVRDQGFSASVELRLPFFRDPIDGRTILQVAPFFDIGGGWQRSRGARSDYTELQSAGIALRLQPWRAVRAELIWAERLKDVDRPEGLQGDGIQFRVVLDLAPEAWRR